MPSTIGSRIILMCYAVVGIPILLITTADYAKFISQFLSYCYEKYLIFKHRLIDKLADRID